MFIIGASNSSTASDTPACDYHRTSNTQPVVPVEPEWQRNLILNSDAMDLEELLKKASEIYACDTTSVAFNNVMETEGPSAEKTPATVC